jgi:hypothetical protein
MKTTKLNQATTVSKTIPLVGQKSKPMQTTIKQTDSRKTKAEARSTGMAELTHAMIAQRAWRIWNQNGRIPGRDRQNWLEAERQLKTELGIS